MVLRPSCAFLCFGYCCLRNTQHSQIMKTINRIRSKDPDIYDSKKEWFADEDEDGPRGELRTK